MFEGKDGSLKAARKDMWMIFLDAKVKNDHSAKEFGVDEQGKPVFNRTNTSRRGHRRKFKEVLP